MPASALAAIPTLHVIGRSEYKQTFLDVIIDSFFKIRWFVRIQFHNIKALKFQIYTSVNIESKGIITSYFAILLI